MPDKEAMALFFPELELNPPYGNEIVAAEKALKIVQYEQLRCGTTGGPGTGTYRMKDLARAIQKALLEEMD